MPPDAPSDETLVQRFVNGDRAAFAELVTRHERPVFALCLRILGNRQDAEDAAQEAFVAVAQRGGAFRADARFTTWLYRVAHNAAIDLARRRSRWKAAPLDTVGELAASGADPAGQVTTALAVETALRAVPADFRAAVVCCDLLGLGYEEAAEVLGVPVGTVKSRVHRGRAALAERLGTLADPLPSKSLPGSAERG